MIPNKVVTILLFMSLNVTAKFANSQPAVESTPDFASVASTQASHRDWPQWRGQNRDGIAHTSNLIDSWPATGPKELWRKNVGDGYAGILVVAERLITAYSSDGYEVLFCLDAASGDEIWRFNLNKDFKDNYGNGPRSTPAVDGEVVFALGSYGLLSAVSLTSGEQLWQVNVHDKVAGGKNNLQRGYVSSPLVEGNLVILHAGRKPGKNIVAFDRRNGDLAWTSQTGDMPYSSAMAITVDGVRQIINFVPYGLVALTTEGKELWSCRWETRYGQNIAAPLFQSPDRIFISSDTRKGGAMFRIVHAKERWHLQQVWQNQLFKNKFHSSVLVNNHIYGFDKSTLKCLSAATGEEKWKVRGPSGTRGKFGRGTLIAADDKLFVLGENGHLALVRADAEKYRELASIRLFQDRCWTMPTLANGKLYARNREEMVCLDVEK